jgi:hypothetical protein
MPTSEIGGFEVKAFEMRDMQRGHWLGTVSVLATTKPVPGGIATQAQSPSACDNVRQWFGQKLGLMSKPCEVLFAAQARAQDVSWLANLMSQHLEGLRRTQHLCGKTEDT